MKRWFIVTLTVVMGFSAGIVANASADSIQGKSAVGVNLRFRAKLYPGAHQGLGVGINA